MIYSYKHCFLPAELQVKGIDEANRKVDIIVSSMGDKDSDEDIIYPGAFKKTIQEKGPKGSGRIKHLKQHITGQVIGKPEELIEENNQLRAISLVSNSTLGRDTIEDYKLDLYEHSIGFRIVKGEGKDDHYAIYEAELWEYSSVTWGANENTPLNGIKSLAKEDPTKAIDKVNKRMNLLVRAITKGNYTDERFEALEIELKQIQQLYQDIIDSLKKHEEPPISTPKANEPNVKIDYEKLLTDHFVNKILN